MDEFFFSHPWLRKAALLILPVLLASAFLAYQFSLVNSAGGLTVTILAGYNLVVDSNVSSPSTYAPRVATVAGKFCNTGASTITNVYGYIGDFDETNGITSTVGIYPMRWSSDASFQAAHSSLNTPNIKYRFTHIGSASDARRFVGDLAPGECRVQYWHFTYPVCEANQPAPCSLDPVWGASNDPTDDLWLNFDVWGEGSGGAKDNKTWKMTMRNEISAMANKIEPNPSGAWFNTNTSTVYPGDTITSNGVRYDLGTINKGFDNNGDFLYDYNVWLQPIGDPAYDPSCFRLIRTTGVLTVSRSGGNPPLILNFTDQLYFTNLPEDNNGATGNVYYTFLALGGKCSVGLSPYQEAASGADNEKFNGDYGTGVPPLDSYEAAVSLDKVSIPASVGKGSTYTYRLPFANTGTAAAGLTMTSGGVNMPLVISDTVPAGLSLAAGSAICVINGTPGGCTIQYSTDSGKNFSSTAPVVDQPSVSPGNLVVVRWWLNAPLPAGQSGYAELKAVVPLAYAGTNFIENTACASYGDAQPFTCKKVITGISGINSIGDLVWNDANADGVKQAAETGLANVTVKLYWDKNGDQKLDSGDIIISTTLTNASGAYLFPNLGDGRYLVQVDDRDTDIPTGLFPTTQKLYDVALDPGGTNNLAVAYLTADFGFGPILRVDKRLVSTSPILNNGFVTYTIDLINTRPGDGTSRPSVCSYPIYAGHYNVNPDQPYPSSNQLWTNEPGAVGPKDLTYAKPNFSNNDNVLGLGGYTTAPRTTTIRKVELVLHTRELSDLRGTNDLTAAICINDVCNATTKVWGSSYFSRTLVTGGTDYVLSWDVTSLQGSWTWSQFSNLVPGNDTVEVKLVAGKNGSNNGDLGLDAAAIIVTADNNGDCGGLADTILTLPLTDTFDADLLRFVRAAPTQSSTATVGTAPDSIGRIFWNNLGPLYAGQTKSINVTFRALDPGASEVTTQNYISVTQAKMADGRPTNKAYDNEPVTIPAGSIAGRVFSQVSGGTVGWAGSTGWDAGDVGIPNARVTLYACMTENGTLLSVTTYDTSACTSNQNKGTWVAVASTTADSGGWYRFDGLPNAWYYVQVDTSTIPGGGSSQNADPIPNNANNGATCSGAACDSTWGSPTNALNLTNFNPINTANEDINFVNFGYALPAVIYGNVWRDVNANGVQQTGETGLAGIQVELVDCGADGICADSDTVVSTATTNASGDYSFTSGLTSGRRYFVRVKTSTWPGGFSGWNQTFDPDSGSLPCTGLGCDNRYAGTVPIVAGTLYGPINFAYTQTGTASIGDTLFRDWNGNGVQNTGDTGIASVTMLLYRDSNSDGVIDPLTDPLVVTTTTNTNGQYLFSNLPDGSYIVKIDTTDPDMPAAFIQTYDADGTKDGQTVKITVSGGTVTAINGSTATCSGNCSTAVDFGYLPFGFGSIGDTVFRDTNANGIQDAGETGLANIGVQLWADSNNSGTLDAGDALISTTQTTSAGAYLFPNLPAGNFFVAIESLKDSDIPTDAYGNRFVLTTDDGLSFNGSTNNPLKVTLASGQNYLQADFGFGPGATLGDLIWRDLDGDGLYDPLSESGIANVTVDVYFDRNGNEVIDSEDQISYTVTTNASGQYLVNSVPAGAYIVKVRTSTLPNSGANWTLTGDPDAPTTPCSGAACDNQAAVRLEAGQINLTADFGYKAPGSIGDFVWLDNDGDGVQDAGEPGLGGVVLRLTPPANVDLGAGLGVAVNVTTDSDGKYAFGNLADGAYTLDVITPPAGASITYDRDGTANGTVAFTMSGGNVNSIGGSACSSPTCTNTQFDFGYRTAGSNTITGTVFFDHLNNGGIYNNSQGDQPIGNVTLYLYNSSNQLIATTTAISTTGRYTFTNVPSGNYNIVINTTNPQLAGLGQTSTPQYPVCSGNPCDNSSPVTVSGNLSNQDFGFYATMDCGDLPDSYNLNPNYRTVLSTQGPCHVRQAGDSSLHFLGTKWDSEDNGQPDSGATGDDNTPVGNNDEDGFAAVNFPVWAANTTQYVTLNTNGANTYVAGWFDWNNNGRFVDSTTGQYDPGEYIYFGMVPTGGQNYAVSIPAASGCCNGGNRVLYVRIRAYEGFSPPPVIAPGGNIIDGEVEDYRLGPSPTAVDLGGFSATQTGQQVTINWQTLSERDLTGFNIYRSTSPSGPRRRLNTDIILTQGPTAFFGADYQFVDEQAELGVTYYYWLESVDLDGKSMIGPVQVTLLRYFFLPAVRK